MQIIPFFQMYQTNGFEYMIWLFNSKREQKKIINIYIYNLGVSELQEPTYRNSQVSWIFSKDRMFQG